MFARVPASSANLGPGFDTLAVALGLYVEVTVEPAPSFELVTSGEGAGRFDDDEHLAVRVIKRVLGHDLVRVTVHSNIPVARGFGSSAALALAAAAAATAPDPLAEAVAVDGHAENAAASYRGGLVTASVISGAVVARSLPLDPRWRFVAVVPDEELSTSDARAALPATVPFADAVRNLNMLGLLIAGLANLDDFDAHAMDDTLHQPYRMSLLPYASELLSTLRAAGAAASCWSGAGSTMLALVTESTAPVVADAAAVLLAERSVAGTTLVVAADRTGLVTR